MSTFDTRTYVNNPNWPPRMELPWFLEYRTKKSGSVLFCVLCNKPSDAQHQDSLKHMRNIEKFMDAQSDHASICDLIFSDEPDWILRKFEITYGYKKIYSPDQKTMASMSIENSARPILSDSPNTSTISPIGGASNTCSASFSTSDSYGDNTTDSSNRIYAVLDKYEQQTKDMSQISKDVSEMRIELAELLRRSNQKENRQNRPPLTPQEWLHP